MPIAGLDNRIEPYGHHFELGPSTIFTNGFKQLPNRNLMRALGEDRSISWFNVFDPADLLVDASVTTQRVWNDPVHQGDANFPKGYGYVATNQLPVVNLADSDFSGMPSVAFAAGSGAGPSGACHITMREPNGPGTVPPANFTIFVPWLHIRPGADNVQQALANTHIGGTARMRFDILRVSSTVDRLRFWTDASVAPGSLHSFDIAGLADGKRVPAVKFVTATLTSTLYFDGVPLSSFVHSHAPPTSTGQLFGFGNLASGLAPAGKVAGVGRAAIACLDRQVERTSRTLINMMTF